MSKIDLIKASYEAARNEINVRLRIRSQTISLYMAVSGILLGFIVKGEAPKEFIVLISFFALAGTLLITHQNISIALASSFCGRKLKNKFKEVPMWNNCAISKRDAKNRRSLRFVSQLVILLFPPLLGFLFLYFQTIDVTFLGFIGTQANLFSLLILSLVCFILYKSKTYRERAFGRSIDNGDSV